MIKPTKNIPSLYSLSDLSIYLEVDPKDLSHVASIAPSFYYPNPIKDNRQTYTIAPPLSDIQNKILNTLLKRVDFPEYLQGGISSRSYINDAEYHLQCSSIIHEDIFHFFDNIKYNHILDIWKNFYNFPLELAKLLTNLSIKNGCLPQGASTSSYLSNLVFWENEHILITEFTNHGYLYSRYIDDIQVSSKHKLTKIEIKYIVSTIISFLRKHGFNINRKKHYVSTSSLNIKVHNLNLQKKSKITIPKKYRKNIKAGIFNLGKHVNNGLPFQDFTNERNSLLGKIHYISSFHPKVARDYIERLQTIEDIYKIFPST